MLDVFAVYATDEKKENDGVEVCLGGDAYIKVARLNNPNFNRMILAENEKHKDALESLPGEENAKLDTEIMCRVLADTILLGFRGLGYKGKARPYSKANAIEMLQHKDFRLRVLQEAGKIEHFRAASEVADAKK